MSNNILTLKGLEKVPEAERALLPAYRNTTIENEVLFLMLSVYIDHYVALTTRLLKDRSLKALERRYLRECREDALIDKDLLFVEAKEGLKNENP